MNYRGNRCVLNVLVQMALLHLCGVAGYPNELESGTQQKYRGQNTSAKTLNIDITKHKQGRCGCDDLEGKWIPTNKKKNKDMEYMPGGSQTFVKKKLSRRVCNGYFAIAMVRHWPRRLIKLLSWVYFAEG